MAHLPGCTTAAAHWSQHLNAGGLLLIEELARLEAADPALSDYLQCVDQVMRDAGQMLYAGSAIESFVPEGTQLLLSDVAQVQVARDQAVKLALMSLEHLRHNQTAMRRFGSDWTAKLEAGLLTAPANARDPLVVHVRQHALRRT
jgi:hypothetical protein